ncbi:MAG: hypothetical protein EBU08_22555, partial [Micrococcales bacterium]|nr:hypothetical protein [Micrococcales bacterium]
RELVILNEGDAVVFRDDTAHSGGYYIEAHFGRLHCYISCPKMIAPINATDKYTNLSMELKLKLDEWAKAELKKLDK